MNKIAYRRIQNIDKIANTFVEAWKNGQEIDDKKMIRLLSANLGLAHRTAKEYMESGRLKAEIIYGKLEEESFGLREEDSKGDETPGMVDSESSGVSDGSRD